jgi:hypothetical protein
MSDIRRTFMPIHSSGQQYEDWKELSAFDGFLAKRSRALRVEYNKKNENYQQPT